MYYLYGPSSYHQPVYNPGYFTAYHPNIRQLLRSDSNLLFQSANESKKLMEDASMFLDKLLVSNELNASLLNGLPASTYEINSIIHSIRISSGITSEVKADYSPGVLRLYLTSKGASIEISLRWR
ncbi:hypothetical protein [Bacillus paramycoides]|uniref:hypothetical protein n=1 Tax=Bacillus paramycoides TaxID=2026194 RepID=UPI002E1F09F4|nr:hypothetical protein [Bacillus paramycoides]